MTDFPYIHSKAESRPIPLSSYFPPYRTGIVSAWLNNQSTTDGLILTPFGSSPQAILEAAREGFRVLVPAHNPIMRFLIEGLAKPITRDTLNSTLVKLASSYKGSQRIKPLILSLYETDCPQCGGKTSASSFTWSKEQAEPISKTCRCSTCGENTRGDVSGADIAKALEYQDNSPTHARALTRVSAPDDPIRVQVEIALRSYLPRSVYALITILNKLSGLNLTDDETKYLEMLLLYAFYRSSSPDTRILAEHQEESSHDDNYLEENVWYSLESALDVWCGDGPGLSVTTWPDLPPTSGGISIYPGRVRELIPHLSGLAISGVMLVYPSPRLSFWALSALWTGWLWGQEAAAPLRSILTIRNYDWTWMARAIGITLTELRNSLPEDLPYLGLLPDLNTEYLLASLSASSNAGLSLEGLAIEPELKMALTSWRPSGIDENNIQEMDDREIIRRSGLELLTLAGEPKHTLHLYGAGMAALIDQGSLKMPESPPDPEIYFPRLVKDFDENIAYRQGFLHFSKIEKWWHQDLSLSASPQADQVEQTLVSLLVNTNSPLPEIEIYQHIYQAFPGLQTPSQGLIKACLNSYAEKDTGDNSAWILKQSDQPAHRLNDLKEIDTILKKLGSDLGFTIVADPPQGNIIHQAWITEVAAHYHFYISVSGLINKILSLIKEQPIHSWIILPGSRAGLIHHKMLHNPPLEEEILKGYGLVKFRHLRRLAEQGGLTHGNLQERLALDPFTSESPQIPLI